MPAFLPGQVQIRPGVYEQVTTSSPPPPPSLGIVGAVFRASWGPLGVATKLQTYDQIAATYGLPSGIASTVDVAQQAFLGGAQSVVAVRLGTGGVAAHLACLDSGSTAATGILVTAKYPGIRGNTLKVTIRTNLIDGSKRDFLVYEGLTLRETVTYTVTGADEAQSLVDAVAAAGSSFVVVTYVAIGTGTLLNQVGASLASGADPAILAADYSAALLVLEPQDWDVLVTDTDDVVITGSSPNDLASIRTLIQAYVDRVRAQDDNLCIGVLAETTAISLATRQAHAAAINDFAIVYVGNGFNTVAGADVEGYRAAGRVAGMIAATPITQAVTHQVVPDGASVAGPLAVSDIINSILNGLLVFSAATRGAPQIEYGITTLITPDANHDIGWKKIRRVRTRDFLMESIIDNWTPLLGVVNNDSNGRATLVARAEAIMTNLINRGALTAATIAVDPANPPSGNTASFIATVQDTDSAEILLVNFSFAY